MPAQTPLRPVGLGALRTDLLEWFGRTARDLPWRGDGARPWPVLVSEVMLQQTPVARVLPVFRAWLDRWPQPGDLAADRPGDAVRMWGRLGYPRRALRLHAAAVICVEQHGGRVPERYDEIRALPGVGDYTAAAVASFAFGQRQAVLDTNVRRVLARAFEGRPWQSAGAPAAAERLIADRVLPRHPATAAAFSAALMELGALVCRAREPRCGECPLSTRCSWRLAGSSRTLADGAPRRPQAYEGTDRQARGDLLAALRASPRPVGAARLRAAWPEPAQRQRALATLIADGLVQPLAGGRFGLPA